MPRPVHSQTPRAHRDGAPEAMGVTLSGSTVARTPVGIRLLDVNLAAAPVRFRIDDAPAIRVAPRSFALTPADEPRRLSVRSPDRFLRVRLDPAALTPLDPAMLAGVVLGRDLALLDAADAIAARLRGGEAASRSDVDALVDALGAALARGPDSGLRVVDVGGCVGRALDFIESHFDKPITVDAVAKAADAPRLRLARRFRLATGVPIREFIRRRRIARATTLLQAGGAAADVACAAGFGSRSHMTRSRLGRKPGDCAQR